MFEIEVYFIRLSSPVYAGSLMRVQYPKLRNMAHTTFL